MKGSQEKAFQVEELHVQNILYPGRRLGEKEQGRGRGGRYRRGTEPDHTGLLAAGRSLYLILLQGEATEGAWRRVMANSHPEHSLGPGFTQGLGIQWCSMNAVDSRDT